MNRKNNLKKKKRKKKERERERINRELVYMFTNQNK